ncbi:MAG: TolC family protein [Gemmatimonadota bacterium]|jgi:outer membrane protein TolC
MITETSRDCQVARTRGLLAAVALSALLTAALLMAVLLTFAAPLPVGAQEGGPIPARASDDVTILNRVVDEALRNNLGLAQERLLVDRAEAERSEARGRYLPTVSIDGRYSEQSGSVDLGEFVNPVYATLNQITGTSGFPTDLSVTLPYTYESRLRVLQPILNERARAGMTASSRALDGQRARSLAAARAAAAEAQTALLQVGAARGARRTWEATLELVEESERVAERLVEVGSATPDAVYRASAERSRVEQQVLESREREAAAARSFNRLVGRPFDAAVEDVPTSVLLRDIDLTEDEAVASALGRRDEIRAVEAGIDAARASSRLATAGFLPDVSLAFDYGFQGSDVTFARDSDFWMASLIVSWSLFDGGQDVARRSAAQADIRRMELQRDDTEDLIRLEVHQAYRAAVVAHGAIATADDQLAAARRTFELVRRRYEEGLATPVEFLDARTALTEAELNRVITVYSYAIRWVDLERAAGLREMPSMEDAR